MWRREMGQSYQDMQFTPPYIIANDLEMMLIEQKHSIPPDDQTTRKK